MYHEGPGRDCGRYVRDVQILQTKYETSSCLPHADPTGHSGKVVYRRGVVTLTSHRIIWCSESHAVEGHLSLVVAARKSRNIFKPSR